MPPKLIRWNSSRLGGGTEPNINWFLLGCAAASPNLRFVSPRRISIITKPIYPA
ncbi:MAG: hypothetical protein KME29_32705 [Calothrix sp. FI2-JRJ7]|nr:hypothetical protein [Calothrix sp. FI2-JRJ7]